MVEKGKVAETITSLKIKDGKLKTSDWDTRNTSSTMYLPYKLTGYQPNDYSLLKWCLYAYAIVYFEDKIGIKADITVG